MSSCVHVFVVSCTGSVGKGLRRRCTSASVVFGLRRKRHRVVVPRSDISARVWGLKLKQYLPRDVT